MTVQNVTGVVLAAGFGTRLRPSTEICPKPLIPVAGVEPLFFALKKLKSLGVKNVIVNAHYLPNKIQDALRDWAPLFTGMNLRLSIENPIIFELTNAANPKTQARLTKKRVCEDLAIFSTNTGNTCLLK